LARILLPITAFVLLIAFTSLALTYKYIGKKGASVLQDAGCCVNVDEGEPIVVSPGRNTAKEESPEETDVRIFEVYGQSWGQESGAIY
jgi:hypothetical protein